MPLFDILTVPKTKEDLESWSFSNKNQVDLIRSAVLKQKNINLAEYQLYPIDLDNPIATRIWLESNSQAHNDFNAVLGLQSADIQDVDFADEKQREAWVNLVYQELYSACAILKI